MPPYLYRVIALENDSITIILRHLKNRVVRIGVLRVLRLESSNFFQVVFLEDQFAINHGKGSRRKAGLVVEVGVFRHRVVGILHTDGGEYLHGTDHHGITNDHRLGGVPLPVSSADAEMVELVTRGGSCGFHEFPRFPVILGHALATNHQAAKEAFLLERDYHLAAVHFVSAENRAGAGDVLAILFGKRPARHSHPRV